MHTLAALRLRNLYRGYVLTLPLSIPSGPNKDAKTVADYVLSNVYKVACLLTVCLGLAIQCAEHVV